MTGDEKSLVFGDSGGNVIFASLDNPSAIKMVKKNRFHGGIVINCEISKDKKFVVTSSTDHSMKVFSFDEENGIVKEVNSIHQNNGWVWGLKMLNKKNMFLAVSSDSYITVWNINMSNAIKETENDLIEGKNKKERGILKKSVESINAKVLSAQKDL